MVRTKQCRLPHPTRAQSSIKRSPSTEVATPCEDARIQASVACTLAEDVVQGLDARGVPVERVSEELDSNRFWRRATTADMMLELPVDSLRRIVEEMLKEQGAEGYRVSFDAACVLAENWRQWLA